MRLRLYYNRSQRLSYGFTLIELLVVISIIALLLSILLPSLGKAREQAKKIVCASDMRSCGIILSMFNDEYDGRYPEHQTQVAGYRWPMTMSRAGFEDSLPGVPLDGLYNNSDYPARGCVDQSKTWADAPAISNLHLFMYNYDLYMLAKRDIVPRPSEKVAFNDGYRDDGGVWYAGWDRGNYWNTYPNIGNWHDGGANLLMVDGHTEWQEKNTEDMTSEMWKVYRGETPRVISDVLHFPE